MDFLVHYCWRPVARKFHGGSERLGFRLAMISGWQVAANAAILSISLLLSMVPCEYRRHVRYFPYRRCCYRFVQLPRLGESAFIESSCSLYVVHAILARIPPRSLPFLVLLRATSRVLFQFRRGSSFLRESREITLTYISSFRRIKKGELSWYGTLFKEQADIIRRIVSVRASAL